MLYQLGFDFYHRTYDMYQPNFCLTTHRLKSVLVHCDAWYGISIHALKVAGKHSVWITYQTCDRGLAVTKALSYLSCVYLQD